ncbi:hypothetical protein BY996DRAFT_8686331 [Phakopsora pachyrhizi]|nr:hypothetical protein BY996DRAFT_8686331 [Phakopsora pachyrhizi]
MEIEDPSITTTQAAEIEAPSDSVSKTLKHQLSHQSNQNPLPPTKRHSKRLQALPKTQAGRVLQGFQSSYSLRNPTGQGLIPQGGIPISAKDCEIQENKKSTDNVPVNHEKNDEEQLESETHVPTEEAPITSGSEQTLPAGVNIGFQRGAVTSIELMEKRSFTAEEVSQELDNCMFIIRESLKICGRKNIENEELDMVYKALPSFIVDRCQSVVYEELLTVLLQSSSLKTHYGPNGESVIGGAGIKKVTNSKYPNLEHKLTKNATESKVKFEQQCLYCLSNFLLLGPQAIFTANSQDH